MTLKEWMEEEDIDISFIMKELDVSVYAVKKWLTGERVPWSKTQQVIFKMSKGKVTPNDWILVK